MTAIDSRHQSQRYPYCVVWTQLPLLSWILPTIGHTGICTSDGTIHDFSGSFSINIGNMAFGGPMKVWKLTEDSLPNAEVWDEAIRVTDRRFSCRQHNICLNNCHDHVAAVLNYVNYQQCSKWKQRHIWWNCLYHGYFLSRKSAVLTILPPVILWGGILVLLIVVFA